jgi:hypothetical protein
VLLFRHRSGTKLPPGVPERCRRQMEIVGG